MHALIYGAAHGAEKSSEGRGWALGAPRVGDRRVGSVRCGGVGADQSLLDRRVERGCVAGSSARIAGTLDVERAMAFFAAWLLVLIVVAQAFKGRLPTEISGRGVRYADADAAQAAAADTEAALNVVRRDVAHLRDAVFVLEGERETRDTETI